MTAPAVITGFAPSSGASATNATPSVAAVVHELPIVEADQAADRPRSRVEERRLQHAQAVVHDRGDRSRHVPGADQRADREQDEDRPHRGRDAADDCVADRARAVAEPQGEQARDDCAGEQRDLERTAGRVGAEDQNRRRDHDDQHTDRGQRHGERRGGARPVAGVDAPSSCRVDRIVSAIVSSPGHRSACPWSRPRRSRSSASVPIAARLPSSARR